jgi:hypothetical protein
VELPRSLVINMAPSSRFRGGGRGERRREVTPFADDSHSSSLPTSTTSSSSTSPTTVCVADEIPDEWRAVEAPPNFTWVGHDELAGMGWPKSRDQLRFLVEQGIDHVVTLSADKIPPHYAFPELKWSLIPVEDFRGPGMREIRQFLDVVDAARTAGEAVGVHCAEGRGRTGVMCAW